MSATAGNICDSQVDTRLRGTVIGFGLLLAAVVGMASLGAPPWAMGFLLIPAFLVSLNAYQSLFRTCIFMAAAGKRDLGEGAEKCACPVMSADLRATARKIFLCSLGTAGALTALAVAAATRA